MRARSGLRDGLNCAFGFSLAIGSAVGFAVGFAAAFATSTIAAAQASAAAPRCPGNFSVHGHRGARARFPENTWPAFEYAIAIGADFLEMDMAVTADDRIVLSHEPFVTRALCRGPADPLFARQLAIRSLRLEELRRYDCGARANPAFPRQRPVPGTPMPTLDEVFDRVAASPLPAARRVRFNIETKLDPRRPELAPPPAEFVRLFLEVVRRHGMLDRVLLESKDYRTLDEARRQEPRMRLSLLTSDRRADWVELARVHGAAVVSPEYRSVDPVRVASAHATGLRVLPWTPNEPREWAALVAAGVDGIITDDPEALRGWCAGAEFN